MSSIASIYNILVLIIKTLQYLIGAIEKAKYMEAIETIRSGATVARNPDAPLTDRLIATKRVQDALNRKSKSPR